jgi:hypothetical protein
MFESLFHAFKVEKRNSLITSSEFIRSTISVTFVMLPFVTFPIHNVYLPKRLNALAPKYDAIGMTPHDGSIAVPEDRTPVVPHTILAPKKNVESEF